MNTKAFFNLGIEKLEGFKKKSSFEWEIDEINFFKKATELYCNLETFENKLPDRILKYLVRIEDVKHFCSTPRRERGIYRSGNDTGELDFTIADKDTYFLKLCGSNQAKMKSLYEAIRIGTVRPYKSYEKEQCKEDVRLASVLIRKIKGILYKSYFWPFGFWSEVKNIVSKAESEMAA